VIIDENVTRATPLSRNRFLAGVGTFMTATAAAWWFPAAAQAAVPNGCHGFNQCSACSGSKCTRSDCRGGNFGCEGGGQCWSSCAYEGSTLVRIRCCDWSYGSGHSGRCICRAITGSC